MSQSHAALGSLGWDDRLAGLHGALAPGLEPGRVIAEDRGRYLIATARGELSGSVSGKLRFAAEADASVEWPTVGDWVGLEPSPAAGEALVHAVLPRRTAVVRRAPSDRGAPTQVLAANVDTVFIVSSLNGDLNLRRLERYLAVAWDSGATPVILLSKADLADDLPSRLAEVESIGGGVDIVAVSVVSGDGIERVRSHLTPGCTVVFVGSSGVGKSSLVNALAGAPILATAEIRADDARGRHTTTRRQLLRLADGLVIDTPGLRELGVVDADSVGVAFDDVERFAAGCRFSDCDHRAEPGCAVRAAVTAGALPSARLDGYQKLRLEARRAALATDAVARRAERKRWTAICRSVDLHMKAKYGDDR
ncbi:MAG TPA: ribosome small subunit-dependent GTPase A [Candidatus Deferrimicrobiaceae bacterium]|nr:ribosome small subunit-dependent GTPase A [Candidatus Deferrimicrobiaceae bacterium]